MNMQQLRRTRKAPRAGEVFTFRLKARGYGYGRVIRTDCNLDGMSDTILIYIYARFDPRPHQDVLLGKAGLLLPPMLTNRLAWTRGYFQPLAARPQQPGATLRVNCFWDDVNECYVNEDGKPLKRRSEPCGFYALNSFRTIDRAISEAVGIPPSPDTLPPADE